MKNIEQINVTLGQEGNQHWASIQDENYDFDGKERLLEALESVTPDAVNKKVQDLLNNQRRLNVKFNSQNHLDNETEVTEAKKINHEFY